MPEILGKKWMLAAIIGAVQNDGQELIKWAAGVLAKRRGTACRAPTGRLEKPWLLRRGRCRGLYQHPEDAIGFLALSDQTVPRLFGPIDDIVDVQGIMQDRLDQGGPVAFYLSGQGGNYSGA